MIAHQQDVYKWQFTFLAANPEAFAEAGGMGINEAQAAQFGAGKVLHANMAVANKVARMRAQKASGENVVNEFTPEERKSME
jgi:predicted ribonuclease toxin of YeeF-YezG toxin-antitoxin module